MSNIIDDVTVVLYAAVILKVDIAVTTVIECYTCAVGGRNVVIIEK